jgi:hypothetical protein
MAASAAAPRLVVCTSHEGSAGSRSLCAMVDDLGGVVVTRWRADVTHVVASTVPNSAKCQRAAEEGVPVVHEAWVRQVCRTLSLFLLSSFFSLLSSVSASLFLSL